MQNRFYEVSKLAATELVVVKEAATAVPNGTIPRKASEAGACKDLESHTFTIGSGNKGKDRDMLRPSMEMLVTCSGTKYGDEAAQEWTSGKKITPSEPAYSQAIHKG